jgi:hypothetical protein
MFINSELIFSNISQAADNRMITTELPITSQNSGVNSTFKQDNLRSDSDSQAALIWVIPVVIVAVVFLVVFAIACFYGLRALEMKMIACCRACGCCQQGRQYRYAETDKLALYKAQDQSLYTGYSSNADFSYNQSGSL